MIDVYATQQAYFRHLAPVVAELGRRGHEVRRWAGPKKPWGAPLKHRREPAPVALCASWIDARTLRPQPCIYLEHGAGQTYVGTEDGYAGAGGLDHVRLFLGPGEHVSARWRARYPQAAVESVGCPALDQHLRVADRHPDPMVELHVAGMAAALARRSRPVVAVTSHWRAFVCNETMPAVHLYEHVLRELHESDTVELVGHLHPRAGSYQRSLWPRLGVRFEADPDRILATADLLVFDNTSLAYEAAALDIPVLALNAPSYRRDVEHGLRFWSHVPGLQCDEPQNFRNLVMMALADPSEARALRSRAAAHAYAHADGSSTRRAADAIEAIL